MSATVTLRRLLLPFLLIVALLAALLPAGPLAAERPLAWVMVDEWGDEVLGGQEAPIVDAGRYFMVLTWLSE